MKKVFPCLLFSLFLIISHAGAQFKKAAGGVQYLVIPAGEGAQLKQGDYFEAQVIQTYQSDDMDTVLYDSRKMNNQVVQFDSVAIPAVYYKILSGLRKGDSAVIKQLTDSQTLKSTLPPFMKKGSFLTGYFKILNIYPTQEIANKAILSKANAAKAKDSLDATVQIVVDNKIIEDYLAKKKIKTVKAPKGTYVQIIKQGTGPFVSAGKRVKVLYTGKTIPGEKTFDSNTDPVFGHTELFEFSLNKNGEAQQVIQGWGDGFSLLGKGAVARLFIPSVLAYGKHQRGDDIAANQCVYFDVEVVDVFTDDPVNEKKETKISPK